MSIYHILLSSKIFLTLKSKPINYPQMKALKYIRIVLALLAVTAVVALFLDMSEDGKLFGLDAIARVQVVPALLSLNVIAILFLAVLTIVFGRIYCSVICPLGIYQDFVGWIRKRFTPKRKLKIGLYKYKTAKSRTRNLVFAAFVIIVLLGILNVMAISLGAFIEPYSAFGRMVTAFVSPVYDNANNYLAEKAAIDGTYDFVPISRTVSGALLVVATITFLVISAFAWIGGRAYCNTICPVGTLLGYLARYSWLRIRIDDKLCNGCGTCQRHCKATCIDSKNHYIDYSRCVDCFDCIGVCKQNALAFRPIRPGESVRPVKHSDSAKPSEEVKENTKSTEKTDKNKRTFIATLGIITGSIVAKGAEEVVGKVTDGGLTPLKERKEPERATRIVPPGALSQAHINAHCVGCQLCIQACPHGLLSMSTSPDTVMQPVLSYAEAFCPPQCTRCSNVCPAGVFKPLDVALKSSWKVGTAVVDKDICLSATGTDSCGNCARHCPAGVIEMVPLQKGGSARKAQVDFEECVGCGACAATCPFEAITMESDRAIVDPDKCVGCGKCVGVCGAEAIEIKETEAGAELPVVNAEACIGCGSCEYHCPVGSIMGMSADRPAIHIEGVSPQRKI